LSYFLVNLDNILRFLYILEIIIFYCFDNDCDRGYFTCRYNFNAYGAYFCTVYKEYKYFSRVLM